LTGFRRIEQDEQEKPMSTLKNKLDELVPAAREDVRSVIRDRGERVISEVTVKQAYGGMRGVKGLVTETSALDPQSGIRFRGYTIPEVQRRFPTAPGGKQPLPEGMFHLLLTGEIPEDQDVAALSAAWRHQESLPDGVCRTLDALPANTHPMTQLSVGVMALQPESIFVARYREGMAKSEYWEATLEDSMKLLARLPLVAAYIYRRTYRQGRHVPPADRGLDWAGNLAWMLTGEHDAEFQELLRLYLTLLADHEGGNVSAHTTHLVGSALSDPYLSVAAGLNGLAGPLHGLASQEVMRWTVTMKEALGGGVPGRDEIRQYIWDTLKKGRVVPGFGHGVLRVTDPRYMAQREFALEYLPDDENFRIVSMLYELVPEVLTEHGKAKNPWPNVDAHTGALFVHYGLREYEFYTVLFGVSRAIGVLASLVWDRALGLPLERPKSVTTEWIRQLTAE
jgi:citrate synthase